MGATARDVSDGALPWGEETAAMREEAAFAALYAAVAPPLLRYLVGMTGRRDVADDLLQETFCRLLERRPATMPMEEARRYVFRIATNLLRDRWRREEDRPSGEAVDAGAWRDPDVPLDVWRMMRSLKPRERELLWLAYVEGLSHAEIAGVTGLSALSIRLLLFRAKGKAATLLRPGKDEG